MASGIVSPFIRAVQETTGKRAPEFAETVLNLKYPTFIYRMRNGCLRYVDYLKICEATGLSLADLFKLLGGDVVRLPVVQEPKSVQKFYRQGEGALEPGHLVKEYVNPPQKKEPVEAPFVVMDLPLTMPD